MNSPETERKPSIMTRRPYVEELLERPELAGDEQIERQARERAAQITAIRRLAEQSGELTGNVIRDAYRGLTTILSDPDYSRLALYIPFDLLTDPGADNADTTQAYEEFKEQYVQSWWQLLSYIDNRPDFIDGNLPDDRAAEIGKVVKAAHLIPELLRRDILTPEDVEWLREQSHDNAILQRSIDEALTPESDPGTYVQIEQLDAIEPGVAAKLFDRELKKILALEGDIVDARIRWFRLIIREQVVDNLMRQATAHADAISIASSLMEGDEYDRQIALATYERLLFNGSINSEKHLYGLLFEAALHDYDPQVREQAATSLARLCRSDVLPKEIAESLEIPLRRLSGNLSENLPDAVMQDIANKVTAMAQDPALADRVYPIATIGGSSLKGYGTMTSDVDVAVFIRPGVSHDDRHEMREALTRIYDDQVIEFWLDETPDRLLRVHDFDEFDFHEADSEWTHSLFQDVWVGEDPAVEEIRKRLLPTYYHDDGDLKRYLYLRRIEQDMLQYRLLQKGYARCYPVESHDDQPDGRSAFWNPGYRMLATQLYAEKVFLPKIDK